MATSQTSAQHSTQSLIEEWEGTTVNDAFLRFYKKKHLLGQSVSLVLLDLDKSPVFIRLLDAYLGRRDKAEELDDQAAVSANDAYMFALMFIAGSMHRDEVGADIIPGEQ